MNQVESHETDQNQDQGAQQDSGLDVQEGAQDGQVVNGAGDAPGSADDARVSVQSNPFPPIGDDAQVAPNQRNIGMLMDVELPVSVELGRVRMFVKDILELGPGAVVELNKFSNEPVDIYLNQRKFAEGEVVVVDQNFGVRITALVGPDERLSHIN